jgi:hypothetical protein
MPAPPDPRVIARSLVRIALFAALPLSVWACGGDMVVTPTGVGGEAASGGGAATSASTGGTGGGATTSASTGGTGGGTTTSASTGGTGGGATTSTTTSTGSGMTTQECIDCFSLYCTTGIMNMCGMSLECFDWLQCWTSCGNTECYAQCDAQYPEFADLQEQLYTCVCNFCTAECATGPDACAQVP